MPDQLPTQTPQPAPTQIPGAPQATPQPTPTQMPVVPPAPKPQPKRPGFWGGLFAKPVGQTNQPDRFLQQQIGKGSTELLDIISPAAFSITPNFIQLNNFYIKTFFVYTYPRFLNTSWLSPVINFDIPLDISMFIYPLETKNVMTQLRRKQTQLEATQTIEREKGLVRDPELDTAIGDIDAMRDILQKGESRIFQFALYFTIYATSVEELDTLTRQLESTLGGMLIYTKQAFLQMEPGFDSTVPLANDRLQIIRNLDTASLSTTFPFTSATLTSNQGILYGINRHNNSLVLFDRFNLENGNSVIFGTSGSGKSYHSKLEALRYMMLGTDVIVIDPEYEYRSLAEAVGGSVFHYSLNSRERINPFDLPPTKETDTGETVLRGAVAMLTGLIGLMVGSLTPEEQSILDKAIYETYALKDITTDPQTHQNPAPVLSDLVNVLKNISGAQSMIARLTKFTEGSFAGLFNQPTNFSLDKGFVVFSIRDLEEQLRPIAMYTILTYIWNKIRQNLRRRLLIIDEAWVMMQHEDSARFVHAIAKRARKYYLGLTIISQDVEDFIQSSYGRSVINNSAMQFLMKQSTTSIDKVADLFKLTEGEKFLLLESDVGEGLFFAGQNHVAIKVIASYTEDQLVTTDPRQILEMTQNPAAESP